MPEEFRGRAMLVEQLEMVPVECVVRGYITGSGWKDYQATGAVCGIELPAGLASPSSCRSRSSRPPPRPSWATTTRTWTSTAPPRSSATAPLLEELRRLSIAVYELGAAHARERGIILADTKFEFGRRADGTIVLGDEVLTPDSSRFWPADGYEPGHGQPSFDKQYVRDWALRLGLGQDAARAALPDDVVARTRELYVDAYERITGEPFERLAGALRRRARVLIRPKEGILDPQGQAVERALPALGFEGVANVHVGRLIELDVEDARRCRRCASGCWPTR